MVPSLAFSQPAGVVNGDTIWLESYSREVGRRAQLNMQAQQQSGMQLSASDVLQSTWLDMVDERLLWQESARRGIEVTQRDVDSVLLTDTPDFVKRGVLNDQGKFDPELLWAMLARPDSLVKARGRNLSAEQLKQQADQLRASMNELRNRTASLVRLQRLRASVVALSPIDSSLLRKSFEEASTTVHADLVYIPCAPYNVTSTNTEPTGEEITAWYAKNADKYKTDEEMRRLAFMVWEMRASPVDSTLVLENVKAFVELLNTTKNKTKRDSIWNSVAETVASGFVRMHPDSANQREFYRAVKGAKVGSAVGPIKHPTGVHVLLVDSVKGKTYVVRAAVTDIDPSQETVDSILREVNTVMEMYERGKTVGELAQGFNRQIEISPFFKRGASIFSSYRLVDVAFRTQVAAMCDPVDAPDRGVVLAIVTDSIAPGPLPIEAAESAIIDDLRRDRSCTIIEKDVKGLTNSVTRRSDGTMSVSAPINGATVQNDITIDLTGMMGQEIYDPLAARTVCNATAPGLIGPLRGDAGWYIVNIRSITRPNPDDYPLYLELRGADLVAQQHANAWETWKNAVRKSAKIEDMRWQYFRY